MAKADLEELTKGEVLKVASKVKNWDRTNPHNESYKGIFGESVGVEVGSENSYLSHAYIRVTFNGVILGNHAFGSDNYNPRFNTLINKVRKISKAREEAKRIADNAAREEARTKGLSYVRKRVY